MYSRAETARLKEAFWTAFGRFLSLQTNSTGEKINWINYGTGHKHVYFRMDVDRKQAFIGMVLRHPDTLLQTLYYDKFSELRTWFTESMGEEWIWEPATPDEYGKPVSKIYTVLPGVNIVKQDDWPKIIRFLQPRIIALDVFWNEVKDGFDELK